MKKRKPAPARRKAARPRVPKKPVVPSVPRLAVSFVSLEVLRNGRPDGAKTASDLSLVLQLEAPGAAVENRVLASARLPLSARTGQTVSAGDLAPEASGRPFFGTPVAVADHVNLHVRLFVERTNAAGPILGAALDTVLGQVIGRIPLLPSPVKEALHIQIGKTIATELARTSVIVPVEAASAGPQPVTIALLAPRTLTGVFAPPGSPEAARPATLVEEGELVALLHATLELSR